MKIIARYAVEVGGHIYSKGDALEWNEPVTRRIAANFRAEDGSPLVADGEVAPNAAPTAEMPTAERRKEVIARTIAALKRDGICLALDGMHVAYSTKSSTEYLARLLLVNRGEIEE